MRIALSTGLFLALIGCQKPTHFMYRVQPPPPLPQVEQLYKVREMVQGAGGVDIVWIIDNSGSMGNDQLNVINNTQLFMQNFTQNKHIQWRIGLISTDEDDKPYVGFTPTTLLDHTTADPVGTFQRAVRRLGISGSGEEKEFTPLLNTITNYPTFFRADAILALILVTDEPEQSRIPVPHVISNLVAFKKSPSRILTYGVLGTDDLGCQEGWNYAGSVHEEFFLATQGTIYSLCSQQFGANLASLGQHIVKYLQRPRLDLPARPVVRTLTVTHKGVPLPGGPKGSGGHWIYDYELNAIFFHDLDFAPGDQEEVKITFLEEKYAEPIPPR